MTFLPVETFHNKWHFTSFPWEMVFYQWKFPTGNGTLLVETSIGNGILSVETFHMKWHFTSGNFP